MTASTLIKQELVAAMGQVVAVMTGQVKRFDWVNVALAAMGNATNAMVEQGLQGMGMSLPITIAREVLETELNASFSAALHGNRFDPEQAAAQAVGNFIGQALAEKVEEWGTKPQVQLMQEADPDVQHDIEQYQQAQQSVVHADSQVQPTRTQQRQVVQHATAPKVDPQARWDEDDEVMVQPSKTQKVVRPEGSGTLAYYKAVRRAQVQQVKDVVQKPRQPSEGFIDVAKGFGGGFWDGDVDAGKSLAHHVANVLEHPLDAVAANYQQIKKNTIETFSSPGAYIQAVMSDPTAILTGGVPVMGILNKPALDNAAQVGQYIGNVISSPMGNKVTQAHALGGAAGPMLTTLVLSAATDGMGSVIGRLPAAAGRSMQWVRGMKSLEDLPLASDRLQLEKLRTQYRQKGNWVNPTEIKNAKLQKVVDNLYREKATIGSGSTADAARVEKVKPGVKVGGNQHIQKAQDGAQALDKLLKTGTLTPHEQMIAENIRLDLLDSLGNKLWYSRTSTPKP